ncbi:MAG: hypothetical protein AAFX06_13940 [Planctomycetota bacterium]
MNCDQCPGVLVEIPHRDYFQCSGCETYRFSRPLDDPEEPIRPSGENVGVGCPKCQTDLQFAELHGQWRVCFCENCRGFVIDTRCLGTLVRELRADFQGEDAAPVPLDPRELDERRLCPACHKHMDTHPYHGPGTAVINSCHGCGVTWMDHREVASIIAAPGLRHEKRHDPVRIRRLTTAEAFAFLHEQRHRSVLDRLFTFQHLP